MKVLVTIPCLNEAKTIAAVIESVQKALESFPGSRVLVIDDGSTDDTAAIAERSGALIASHGYNRGVGVAFHTAVAFFVGSEFDAMVGIDGDAQFDARDIPRLLVPIAAGEADFVTATRFADAARPAGMPRIKFLGNKGMTGLISRLARQRFSDVSCGFRAFSREALLNMNLHGQFTYTQETFLDLASKGLRIREVPVQVVYHPDRSSRVADNIPAYAYKTLLIIVRAYRDYHPLRFFWSLSLVTLLTGLGFGGFLATHYLRTGGFSPHIWAGGVSGFLLLVGLAFFFVGLVSDMLGRIRVNQERILVHLKRRGPRERH